MDRYQTMAAGGNPDAGEDTGNAHKIGKVGAALLIIVSLILDILSIADTLAFEIPIADILATAMAVILLIYLIYKDRSPRVRAAAAGAFNLSVTLWFTNVVAWVLFVTIIGIPIVCVRRFIGC